MTSLDFRNATWASLQATLTGRRKQVMEAWRRHGPCTTAQLSERAAMSILTLRPRTTELMELGFIRLSENQIPGSGEGIYRVASGAEQAEFINRKRREAETNQLEIVER